MTVIKLPGWLYSLYRYQGSIQSLENSKVLDKALNRGYINYTEPKEEKQNGVQAVSSKVQVSYS